MSDDVAPARPLAAGTKLGRFVVRRLIGAGGMGSVYEAHDPELDRGVALKLLHPERDPALGLRLVREAQALAQLAHPNVVSVHDVGFEGTQPFIAMELIDGQTLDAYLETRRRSWRELLPLFVQMARGLAAAHARGIVHRDFKPSNVLVDKEGRARVTDFGLAYLGGEDAPSVDDPPLTASSERATVDVEAVTVPPSSGRSPAALLAVPLTAAGSFVGTPRYMSPEQHARRPATSRSDQYAFCVAFWEALSGEHPQESTRRLPAPRWLSRALRVGLSTNAAARHASMADLAMKLERAPIRRRRLAMVVAAGLLAGGAAAATLALAPRDAEKCHGGSGLAAAMLDAPARARIQEAFGATGRPHAAATFERVERALDGRLAAWAAAHDEACAATHLRGAQSQALLDTRMACLGRAQRQISALVELLGREPDVDRAVPAALVAGDVRACSDLEALAKPVPPPADPEARRRFEELRGRLDALTMQARAAQPKAALATAETLVAEARALGHPQLLAEALERNGVLECDNTRVDAGVALLKQAVVAAGESHDDVLFAKALRDQVHCSGVRGQRFADATPLLDVAEAAVARAGGREDLAQEILDTHGILLHLQARNEEALPLMERSARLAEQIHGEKSIQRATSLNNLGQVYLALDRLDDATRVNQLSMELRQELLGLMHPHVTDSLHNLALIAIRKGDRARARELEERAIAVGEVVLPPDSPKMAGMLHALGTIYDEDGRDDEAQALVTRAVSIREKSLGPDHPQLAMSLDTLAKLALDRHDVAEGKRLAERALAIKRKAYGEDHPSTAHAWYRMGHAHLEAKDYARAHEAYDRALAIREAKLDAGNPLIAEVLRDQAGVYLEERKYADATRKLERALAIEEKALDPQHPDLARTLGYLGKAHLGAGRKAEAAAALQRAVAIMDARHMETELVESYRSLLVRASGSTR